MTSEIIKTLKDPQQNPELHQKIIYSLCNLTNYPNYYQNTPINKEDKEERIEEFIKREKKYKENHKKHHKELFIVNKDKGIFTNEQKEEIEKLFKETVYVSLLNDILFINFSLEEDEADAIKIENNKVFINYWSGSIRVDKHKNIRCQYCPRKLLTKEEAIKIWPEICFHCQDKVLKELNWTEFIEVKKYGWYKPTSRDLEIQEATDKVEYYLKEGSISIEYITCQNNCCSCSYKEKPMIYQLQYYSDGYDMDCGISLLGILDHLKEKEKQKKEEK